MRSQSPDVLCVERCLCSSLCPYSWSTCTHAIEPGTTTSPPHCTKGPRFMCFLFSDPKSVNDSLLSCSIS